ncbi:hypothetical protein RCL1_000863 [Eukaryota sp. TZLM3-RCL]
MFLLYESAAGFALFRKREGEEIANQEKVVQEAAMDFIRFQRVVELVAFKSFTSSEEALEAVNSISEGLVPSCLSAFLTQNLPLKTGKKSKFELGVSDSRLGGALQDALSLTIRADTVITELLRGIRMHLSKFVDTLSPEHLIKAQRGLGHSYSRAKVKFNVNRVDTMIIQTIALIDQLDKDINSFSMRLREWHGWGFPELSKIVQDSNTYVKVASIVPDKNISQDHEARLRTELDGELVDSIIAASKTSIGRDVSPLDVIHIGVFATRLQSLVNLRTDLLSYLNEKMTNVAPNLSAVVGDIIGSRLISHAGSLTNLSKLPASTVQILGAEKALFRALKTRRNTPKYGILFNAGAVTKSVQKNKGRMSRCVANKCSIASRLDSFQDIPNSIIGEAMRTQIEDRIAFYEGGKPPKRNEEALSNALESLRKLKEVNGLIDKVEEVVPEEEGKKEKRKRKSSDVPESKKAEKKKKKKRDE